MVTGGLEPGERLIVEGGSQVAAGQTVTVGQTVTDAAASSGTSTAAPAR